MPTLSGHADLRAASRGRGPGRRARAQTSSHPARHAARGDASPRSRSRGGSAPARRASGASGTTARGAAAPGRRRAGGSRSCPGRTPRGGAPSRARGATPRRSPRPRPRPLAAITRCSSRPRRRPSSTRFRSVTSTSDPAQPPQPPLPVHPPLAARLEPAHRAVGPDDPRLHAVHLAGARHRPGHGRLEGRPVVRVDVLEDVRQAGLPLRGAGAHAEEAAGLVRPPHRAGLGVHLPDGHSRRARAPGRAAPRSGGRGARPRGRAGGGAGRPRARRRGAGDARACATQRPALTAAPPGSGP